MKVIAEGSLTEDDIVNQIGEAALGIITPASLLGGARQPREQGLRRRLPEGQ